jgi:hypothetical protein
MIYDMIYLTAIGLTPGGSSKLYIYTKQYTEHMKKNKQNRIHITIRIHERNTKKYPRSSVNERDDDTSKI